MENKMTINITKLYAMADEAFAVFKAKQIHFGEFSSVAESVEKTAFRQGYIACYMESLKPKIRPSWLYGK